MKVKYYLITILLTIICVGFQQINNKFGLEIIETPKEYLTSIKNNPNLELMDIQEAVSNIVLDIRYATTNNFTGQQVYNLPKAFARKPVIEKLKLCQAEFNKLGYGIKVFDAYRPYAATVKFFQIAADPNFVAHPKQGSRHNRGCAVDITLIELNTGKQIAMPTPYDDFTEKASPTYSELPEELLKNRNLLIDIMQQNGFTVFHSEWWHFDFNGWEAYPLMNLTFEQLLTIKNDN